MSQVIDMTNQRYGKLVVLSRAENDKYGKAQWLCQCDCGNQKIISGASLRKGLTVSCGCHKNQKLKEYNLKHTTDETGNRYGKLVVISRNTDPEYQIDGRAMWNCQCDCGNIHIVSGKLLREGKVGSCGCGIKSLGEKKITQLLEQTELSFTEQYRVYISQNQYQLEQSHPYYFDFAIFEDNKIKYLIEYDGQQHFQYKDSNSFWNNKEKYEQTKIRDNIKNQWCKENNIPLIRIPYTHYKNLCIDDLKLETSQFIYHGGD